MTPDVWFFLGGLVGSGLKAVITTSQETFSRKSVVDIAIGGMVGVLYPLYPIVPLEGTMLQQAAEIAVISYFAGDLLQNAITNRVPALSKRMNGGTP